MVWSEETTTEEETTQPSVRRNPITIVISIIAVVIIGLGVYFYLWVKQSNRNDNQNTDISSVIETTDDPYFGQADAKIVIVEFSDFQCPYCLQAFPVVRQIFTDYKDQIKFIYRDFPLIAQHPQAEKAAEAGECAQEQGKFWEMHDKIFINQSDLTDPSLKRYAKEIGLDSASFIACLDSGRMSGEVQEDLSNGLQVGVSATPTFYFNGRKFEGSMTYEQMSAIIDNLIAIYNP